MESSIKEVHVDMHTYLLKDNRSEKKGEDKIEREVIFKLVYCFPAHPFVNLVLIMNIIIMNIINLYTSTHTTHTCMYMYVGVCIILIQLTVKGAT